MPEKYGNFVFVGSETSSRHSTLLVSALETLGACVISERDFKGNSHLEQLTCIGICAAERKGRGKCFTFTTSGPIFGVAYHVHVGLLCEKPEQALEAAKQILDVIVRPGAKPWQAAPVRPVDLDPVRRTHPTLTIRPSDAHPGQKEYFVKHP